MTQKTQVDTRKIHDLGNTRSRSWVFTFNNYTENDIVSLLTQFTQANLFIFQEEIGGKNNTPHLQGVVKWNNARTFKSMKKLNNKIHWEKCKNIKASVIYCSKEDTRNGKQWSNNIEKYDKFINKLTDDEIKNKITKCIEKDKINLITKLCGEYGKNHCKILYKI